jgi:hypothetical protein
MHSDPGANFFGIDTPATLDALNVSPPDFLAYNGVNYFQLVDGVSWGIPVGAVLDAAGHGPPAADQFFFSWDISVEVAGVVAHPEDLLALEDGITFSIFFDGSAEGVPPGLNLDAAHYLGATDSLLLSFDTSGTIAGVRFDDEDVLEFDRGTQTWELAIDRSAVDAAWSPADLVGLHAVASAEDNCSGFLNPNQGDAEVDGVGDGCDNCLLTSNAGQEDYDGDSEGDACDSDDDNDGLDDAVEVAEGTDPLNEDSDNDGYCDGSELVGTCTDTDDTCPLAGAVPQINSDSLPAGDACQCGDLNADGILASLDVELVRKHLVGATISEPGFDVSRCNIVGPRSGNGDGSDCQVDDIFVLRQYIAWGGDIPNLCDEYFGVP